MKKYLTIAAILGAIAFVSVSYLAQAETQAPAVSADAYAKDSAECATLSAAATTEGAAPTAEVKEAAFKKCMLDKKHTEEEINKAEAAKKEMTAPAPAPVAPEAPAAK